MDDAELSALLKNQASRHRASAALRAAVGTQIALDAAARRRTPAGWARRLPNGWLVGLSPANLLGGFVAGVVLSLAVFWAMPRPQTVPGWEGELVDHHVHAMGVGPLFQVASSDRHTVKPWFQGKLGYAPEVVDLGSAGFPLLGGRLDALAGQPTAALVYAVRLHYISVFERPAEQASARTRAQLRGFHLVSWSDGSMQVWAVSDVEPAELERFASAWAAAVAQAPRATP